MFEHATEERPVVVAEELTKRFGDVLAVDDLSFTLQRGSVAGFLGPNGRGRRRRCACCSGSSGRRPGRRASSGGATES